MIFLKIGQQLDTERWPGSCLCAESNHLKHECGLRGIGRILRHLSVAALCLCYKDCNTIL